MKHIYLDYAAATPMDDRVLRAMEPYFKADFYNPSATYLAGRAARQELEDIRRAVAGLLGARPAEVVFTAGATEANNLAVQGVMRHFPQAEVLVSSIEHESVLAPAVRFKHREIPVDEQGVIILNKLSDLISDKTVLISVMLVNNELGTIQPLAETARLVDSVRRSRMTKRNKLPLYLHTDAAQAANFMDLHISRLGVDMMSLNGGKIYGPKQSGVLYVKSGTELEPLIAGGGQEFGLRSGTENLAAAAGFTQALRLAQEKRTVEVKQLRELRKFFEEGLVNTQPRPVINGAKNHRAPHITSVTFPGWDNERLMMELDERDIQCAVGSACSAVRGEASHVLSAIGLSDEQARSTLRFSLGRQTNKADIQIVLKTVAALTENNR